MTSTNTSSWNNEYLELAQSIRGNMLIFAQDRLQWVWFKWRPTSLLHANPRERFIYTRYNLQHDVHHHYQLLWNYDMHSLETVLVQPSQRGRLPLQQARESTHSRPMSWHVGSGRPDEWHGLDYLDSPASVQFWNVRMSARPSTMQESRGPRT